MKYLLNRDDTIVALATPMGSGAIAVIRLSGSKATTIVNQLTLKEITEIQARKAIYTDFLNASGSVVDQVVATYFKAPASYTGEDILEISCHCNPLIIDQILTETQRLGARVAEPGEFTFRAFMNGKMDLSQAEAVADMINSRTRQSLNQSIRHLEGDFSKQIEQIKKEIVSYLSLLEVSLDFSEDEIELLPPEVLQDKIHKTENQIYQLLKTYDYGRLLQEGVKLLILGKPNVGKSSLLNALVQKERSIVSDIPGTTRDYIEASVNIEGIAINAVDTAGIRQTDDYVEAVGVQSAFNQLEASDIVLCLFDGHKALNDDDAVLLETIQKHRSGINFLLLLNKIDLGLNSDIEEKLKKLKLPMISISAQTSEGLPDLKKAIKKSLFKDQLMEAEEIVVTSARHKKALEKTLSALRNAQESLSNYASEEILALDVRLALDALGEITGETTSEDILNHIFSSFCIGK